MAADNNIEAKETETSADVETVVGTESSGGAEAVSGGTRTEGRGRGEGRRRERGGRDREYVEKEFVEKLVKLNRTAKVVSQRQSRLWFRQGK